MKKAAIAFLLATICSTASAYELGLSTVRDLSGGENRNGVGVTIGKKMDKIGLTMGVEQFSKGSNDQTRFSLVAGYDVLTFNKVTITPKVGIAYLNNQEGSSGMGSTVGVGASVPLLEGINLNFDFARQYTQDRVGSFEGNRVSAGLSYRF